LLDHDTLALHSLRNDFEAFSPLLGDETLALQSLRNNFGDFLPLLNDDILALYSLRDDFRAFSTLLGDDTYLHARDLKIRPLLLLIFCTRRYCFGAITVLGECTFIDFGFSCRNITSSAPLKNLIPFIRKKVAKA
jgi:hypothetical protein